MKVLYAASEAIPFMKTGGLADVVGSLPGYFAKEECEVRVILPKYLCMEKKFLENMHFLCHFYVDLNWRRQYVGVFEATYRGITYYLIDNEFYFAGDQPYNHLHEDVEKFAYFSKAVLQALPYLDYAPEIIHCHDWQTGLVPVFLKTCFGSDPYYAGIKTVFTIHNMKFQGRWNLGAVMDITGLPEQIFNSQELESYGEANYLKGGLVYSDMITTVSENYAHDITTPEGGEGLDGLMYARRDSLFGITNGIDYEEFNPKKDPYLTHHFTKETVTEGKKDNKKVLQKKYGLPEKADTFLLGMVSRMTDQKGFDLVAYVLEQMLAHDDIQFVVLGTGEKRYQEMLTYFMNRYPKKMHVHVGYSEEEAHEIYAACDGFLMPSLFEPCGLSQLMAMRYGTLPIVRETGGLKETVIPYNQYTHQGTGFSFANYDALEMLGCIHYAMEIFRDKKEWRHLMTQAMERDSSWEHSAGEYLRLYKRLLGEE